MVRIDTPYGWSVELTDEQYAAGLMARDAGSWSHYRVWAALKAAGVPVRDGQRLLASIAATALYTSGCYSVRR